ncbi:hypothetical protein C0Q70_11862 [Pomacea canaliculata]|uniref:Uncharacterized protein n=1 Tax=Pomacea canaliculata TaxID=400727 RepID=A0A2T7P755_POMCA|nr:hypothetical protein C0Q70_11862 [Pomacea canaliculata]
MKPPGFFGFGHQNVHNLSSPNFTDNNSQNNSQEIHKWFDGNKMKPPGFFGFGHQNVNNISSFNFTNNSQEQHKWFDGKQNETTRIHNPNPNSKFGLNTPNLNDPSINLVRHTIKDKISRTYGTIQFLARADNQLLRLDINLGLPFLCAPLLLAGKSNDRDERTAS